MRVIKSNKSIVTISIISTLLLSACGGGGSSTESNENEIVNCSTGTTTSLNKGDKIIGQTSTTKVRILHLEDTTKSICVVTGKAIVTLAP